MAPKLLPDFKIPPPRNAQRPDQARKPGRGRGLPPKQGLYDPWYEHDSCGVGFVVDIKGRASNKILRQAIQILKNLDHRGAAGSEANTGRRRRAC